MAGGTIRNMPGKSIILLPACWCWHHGSGLMMIVLSSSYRMPLPLLPSPLSSMHGSVVHNTQGQIISSIIIHRPHQQRGNNYNDDDGSIATTIFPRGSLSSSSAVMATWLAAVHPTEQEVVVSAPSIPTTTIIHDVEDTHTRWLMPGPLSTTRLLVASDTPITTSSSSPSSFTSSTNLPSDVSFSQPHSTPSSSSTTTESAAWRDQILNNPKYKIDTIERILDSTTLRLRNSGNISLQSVRGAGSTYKLPDCMMYVPSHKLKLLLPRGDDGAVGEFGGWH
jgi:hypothetical protein